MALVLMVLNLPSVNTCGIPNLCFAVISPNYLSSLRFSVCLWVIMSVNEGCQIIVQIVCIKLQTLRIHQH